MASTLVKVAAKRMLRGKMDEAKSKGVGGKDDPYLQTITVNGKKRMVRKQIPDFIPNHDHKILFQAKKRAHRMDMQYSFMGFRFGIETVIGLIPEIGDVIGVVFAMNIYRTCRNIEGGLSSWDNFMMMFNIVVDFLLGLVPLLGDIADGYWKCNTRNVRRLENYLIKKHIPRGRSRKYAGLELFEDDPDYNACFGSVEYLMASDKERQALRPILQAEMEAEKATTSINADEILDEQPVKSSWWKSSKATTPAMQSRRPEEPVAIERPLPPPPSYAQANPSKGRWGFGGGDKRPSDLEQGQAHRA